MSRPAGRPRGLRWVPLLGPVLLGVVVGVAWWLLAPTAAVVALPGGTLVSDRHPELGAAQDGVLALLGAGAGLLCGVVAVARPGRAPVRRSLAVLLGSAAGSALAWGVGAWLGPASVAAQRAAGHGGALTSPLAVHSPGVLVVWPVAAALVLTAGHLVAAWGMRTEEADEQADERADGDEAYAA